jgi:hypothetical protein
VYETLLPCEAILLVTVESAGAASVVAALVWDIGSHEPLPGFVPPLGPLVFTGPNVFPGPVYVPHGEVGGGAVAVVPGVGSKLEDRAQWSYMTVSVLGPLPRRPSQSWTFAERPETELDASKATGVPAPE